LRTRIGFRCYFKLLSTLTQGIHVVHVCLNSHWQLSTVFLEEAVPTVIQKTHKLRTISAQFYEMFAKSSPQCLILYYFDQFGRRAPRSWVVWPPYPVSQGALGPFSESVRAPGARTASGAHHIRQVTPLAELNEMVQYSHAPTLLFFPFYEGFSGS